MKTKTFNLLLCIIAVVSFLMISCSEDLGFGDSMKTDNSYVQLAKQIFQNQGSAVSMPNPKADKAPASRSSMSYIADLQPQWEESFTYDQGGQTVVIVPLKCDEDIRSTLSIKDGDETTYQFAKVFSRMIVKPNEGDNGIYVLSYMPESNYASAFTDIESEMGYDPSEVEFTGLIVSSRLNGEVMKSYLYNGGYLEHSFIHKIHKCHDNKCAENHNYNNIYKGLKIKFSLENVNQSRSTNYNTTSEGGSNGDNGDSGNNNGDKKECEGCGQPIERCICKTCEKCLQKEFKCICVCSNCGFQQRDCICGYEICKVCYRMKDHCQCPDAEKKYCFDCGHLEKECVCDKKDEDDEKKKEKCLLCGAEYDLAGDHKCESTPCPVCKNDKCTCNTSATEQCKNCKQKQCICETNMMPILYTHHSSDFLVLSNMEGCVVNSTCSIFAALETACMVHGSTSTQNELYACYAEINNVTPQYPLHLDINSDFLVDYFMVSVPFNIKYVIRYGMPVLVWYNNKYVTVVGIQYDGDIIYADHENGNLYAVHENYFNEYENFVIEGVFI